VKTGLQEAAGRGGATDGMFGVGLKIYAAKAAVLAKLGAAFPSRRNHEAVKSRSPTPTCSDA
jgi:hypothetical protein